MTAHIRNYTELLKQYDMFTSTILWTKNLKDIDYIYLHYRKHKKTVGCDLMSSLFLLLQF